MSARIPSRRKQNKKTKQVVILGAGFGGLSAALEFAALKKSRAQHNTPFDVTIIDRNTFQLFTPDMYEIAAASNTIKSQQDLENMICLDVTLALKQEQITFTQASITNIDIIKKRVRTNNGTLDYDYLLIALGSEPYYFNIPGMKQHSIPFKWLEDAVHIRKTVKELVKHRRTHVLVCGGGPAGVEVAAELMQAYRMTQPDRLSITLVEGRDSILSTLPPRAQHLAMKRLRKLGIEVKSNWLIAAAKKQNIISTTGDVLKGDCIIWTGGIKATSLLEKTKLTLTNRGQISVNATTQSQQDEYIFAIGDAAELMCDGEPSPQTGHEAFHQGPVAAHNIIRHMNGKPLTDYKMRFEGFVVAMGGKHGVVVLPGNIVLSGIIGWFVRRFVDFRHFRSVLPFMHACKQWYTGLKAMNKND